MVKIREKQTEQLEKAASKGLKLGGWKKMTLSSKIAAVVLVLSLSYGMVALVGYSVSFDKTPFLPPIARSRFLRLARLPATDLSSVPTIRVATFCRACSTVVVTR